LASSCEREREEFPCFGGEIAQSQAVINGTIRLSSGQVARRPRWVTPYPRYPRAAPARGKAVDSDL
jgi:hypothetical protein